MGATILFILFSSISGLCKAVSDSLVHRYESTVFARLHPFFDQRFWNGSISHVNKWKAGTRKEKFFLSSTLLVGLTDGWHSINSIQYKSIAALVGITMFMPRWFDTSHFVDASIKATTFWVIYIATFHIFYTWVLVLRYPFQTQIERFKAFLKTFNKFKE